MESRDALRLLQTMIDYFEAGNRETDAAAKAIIESDIEYGENWQRQIKGLRQGVAWTGLRSPEAELVAAALHSIQQMLEE